MTKFKRIFFITILLFSLLVGLFLSCRDEIWSSDRAIKWSKIKTSLVQANENERKHFIINDIITSEDKKNVLQNNGLIQQSPSANLNIIAKPMGSHIFLDEILLGTTNVSTDLTPGIHCIAVQSPIKLFGINKFIPIERTIDVKSGDSLSLTIVLKPNFCILATKVIRPKRVKVLVRAIENSYISVLKEIQGSSELELPSGRYRIEVSSGEPFYEHYAQRINIDNNLKITSLSIELPLIEILKDFIWIPEGRAKIGTLGEEHTVFVEQFFMSKYEITVKEFRKFVQATGHNAPIGKNGNWGKNDRDNHPINCISLQDAVAYTKWLSSQREGILFRLPTEIEWEKAARGEQGNVYPWGNHWEWIVNFCDTNCDEDWARKDIDDKYSTTAPVGSYENASPFGIYDLLGNVAEWCENGSIRGGSFRDFRDRLQTYKAHQIKNIDSMGFRLVAVSQEK